VLEKGEALSTTNKVIAVSMENVNLRLVISRKESERRSGGGGPGSPVPFQARAEE
jgi:hypothetical protein